MTRRRARRRRRPAPLALATRRSLAPHRGPVLPRGPDRPAVPPRPSPPAATAPATPLDASTPDPYALIDAAERPLIWAGAGARDRADEVRALAERLTAPVLTTFGARGCSAPGHPCNVGMPPHVEPAGRLWDEADLVIAFGSDLDGMNTQNWLQPQPPHDRRGQRRPGRRGARTTASTRSSRRSTPDRLRAARRRRRRPHPRRPRRGLPRRSTPRALRFLDAVSYALPDDANVVCDMCIPGYWIAGFHGFRHPRKLQYPMGWGTLGFAFPAALGASLAGTGPTVSISGDGGFLFACGELATMAQEQLPFTAVIVDDGGYGMLRYDQSARRRRDVRRRPRHARLRARSRRASASRAETVEGLDDAFGEALARHVARPGAQRAGRARRAARAAADDVAELVPQAPGLGGCSAGRARRGTRTRAARAPAGSRRTRRTRRRRAARARRRRRPPPG